VTLRLEDRWIWDFWLAEDGPWTHLFYLQAPRSLGDPLLRHPNASIGHAVSRDLRDWTVLDDPLPPSPAGSWDDNARWTGSVLRDEATDGWVMLYTGQSSRDALPVQRIGIATSRDLVAWEWSPEPLLEPDPRWYETAARRPRYVSTWRDPFLFADPSGEGYHALITARSVGGDATSGGVVGHAVSPDLRHWEVRPPLASPAGFGELEVPQVIDDGDTSLLVFSCGPIHLTDERAALQGRSAVETTFVCRGPSLLGPFDVGIETPLPPVSERYAGKLVRRDGELLLLGFVNQRDGDFAGEIGDPEPFDASDVPVADSLLERPPGRVGMQRSASVS
jgi:beta-fructofuranosidase